MTLTEKIAYGLATCCGLTDTRLFPGTIGSALALPLCAWPVVKQDPWLHLALIVAVLALGKWCVPIAQELLPARSFGPSSHWQRRDQSEITIDEVLGMLIATAPLQFVSFGPAWADFGAAFVLFRIFDIKKTFLAAYFDAWHNDWGVLLDDAAAGVQAAAILWAAAWIRQYFIG